MKKSQETINQEANRFRVISTPVLP